MAINALLPILAGLAQGTQQREQRNYDRGLQKQQIDRRDLDSFMDDLHKTKQMGMPFDQAKGMLQARYANTPVYIKMLQDGSMEKFYQETPDEIQAKQNQQAEFQLGQQSKQSQIDYNNNRLQSAEEIAQNKLESGAQVRQAQAEAASALAKLRQVQGEQLPYNTAAKFGEIKYSGKGQFAPNTNFGNNPTGQTIGNVVNSVSPGETTTTRNASTAAGTEVKKATAKAIPKKIEQTQLTADQRFKLQQQKLDLESAKLKETQRLNDARIRKLEQPPKSGGSGSRSTNRGSGKKSDDGKVQGFQVGPRAKAGQIKGARLQNAISDGYSLEAIAKEPANVIKGLNGDTKYTPKYLNSKYRKAKKKTSTGTYKTYNPGSGAKPTAEEFFNNLK